MKNNRILNLFILFSLMGLSACVSKSKHNDEVARYEEQIKSLGQNVQARDEALAKNQSQIKELEEKLVATTKDRGQLRSNVEELNKALAEMKLRREQEQQVIQEFRDLTLRFKKLIDSGALSVKIQDGRMMVSLGTDVLFRSGSAQLSEEGQKTMLEIAQKLNEMPNKRYQVEGHTDNVPIRTTTFPSNWELASARAISVLRHLERGGLEVARVSAASYAETHPVASNDTPETRARNRRIEIVVVPNLENLPGYDELKKFTQ